MEEVRFKTSKRNGKRDEENGNDGKWPGPGEAEFFGPQGRG